MQNLDTAQKLLILEKASKITQNAYFLIDLETLKLTWLTEHTKERLGYDPDQPHKTISEELFARLHPDDYFSLEQFRNQAQTLKDGEVLNREYRFKDSQGNYHWIKNRITPLSRDASGKVQQILGMSTNQDEQKAYENSLNETMEKLLSSAKMAALGEMSGGIAHEINNPLTVIQARAFQLSQMVDHNNLDPVKVRQAAESISRTADKIAKIIKSLRSFAREGTNDPFEVVPLKQIVEETLEFCKTRFYNHGVDVEVSVISSELEIECRLIQIEQVLLNLLNNSFDAIRNLKDQWVRIVVHEIADSVEIHVVDSGTGIPENIEQKIMAPFFTTKESGKGTGLGLSISSKIVRSHHGKLFLKKDAPNTTFVIRLPKWQTLEE